MDFGVQLIPPDGGGIAHTTDGPADRGGPDVTGLGAVGRQRVSAAAAAAAAPAAAPERAAPAAASPCATTTRPIARRTSRTAGCASSRAWSRTPNPSCVAGQCRYSCFPTSSTPTRIAANGCECVKTNAGVEACDGLDNDCDGTVDEGFNFMGDSRTAAAATSPARSRSRRRRCSNGVCTQGACLPGFYDRDPTVPGCETACTKTNGGVEICDGQDNDCDGVVDNNPRRRPSPVASRWASAPA